MRDTKHLECTEHSGADLCLSDQPMCELKHKRKRQAEDRLRSQGIIGVIGQEAKDCTEEEPDTGTLGWKVKVNGDTDKECRRELFTVGERSA